MARPETDLIGKLEALDPERDADVLRALEESVLAATSDLPQPAGGRSRSTEPDQAAWKEFAHLGWLGLLVPEALGGSGGDLTVVGVVARSLGRAGRREPFVAAAVITPLWLMATTAEHQVAGLLVPVVNGSQLIVPAWQARGGGLEIDHDDLPSLTGDGRGTKLNGTCYWVPASGVAGYLVVSRREKDLCLVHVSADTSGAVLHLIEMSDGTSWGHLALTDVEVDPHLCFTLDATRVEAMSRAVDAAVLTIAAELLGSAEGMLDLTLKHLATRRQFGRAIGSHQVLQHKAVDMWLHRELLSSALADAYARLDDAGDPAVLQSLSSGAKARACLTAREVGNSAIQLHGAIGFTEEYPLSHLVNRSLLLSAWLGNRSCHLRRWTQTARYSKDGLEHD